MPALIAEEPRTPVRAPERERPAVRALEAALTKSQHAQLVDPDGRTIAFPKSVFDVLMRVVHAMSRGDGVAVIPVNAVLTTQQAAELLNVSRPNLVELLDRKEMPFEKSDRPGGHRRIRLDDVLAYKNRRNAARRKALEALTHKAEEQGRYD